MQRNLTLFWIESRRLSKGRTCQESQCRLSFQGRDDVITFNLRVARIRILNQGLCKIAFSDAPIKFTETMICGAVHGRNIHPVRDTTGRAYRWPLSLSLRDSSSYSQRGPLMLVEINVS